ncbi:TolC family protein [Caldimonas brevitalea]|uniref:Type I secretion protein TolC n=1 Tax=Caldimonas brevitalea TaxID=413882 RepID=A0A0G3BRN8_9BURK|nr:TolC family protein [Caldimonas brevitalea]AKJ32094.1 type I secretion protein TolC [Caldimonas brevitalea]
MRPVAYGEALEQAYGVSGTVQGARLDAQARHLQAEAVAHLSRPSLSLIGFTGRVSTSFNLDTSPLAGAVNPVLGGVGAVLPGVQVPPIPNSVSTERISNLNSLWLSSLWPLYTAGRLDAVHGLAAGRAAEAEADRLDAEDQQAAVVAQRYFAVQLARRAAEVRAAATTGIAEHQRMASRLEATGLIARSERLRADVALDAARRDEAKARSDLEIAQVALDRLLASPERVQPTTPLFVHSQPVGSLQSFIESGQSLHPAWKKIDSKREQAAQALKLQGSEHAPTVTGVANYNFNQSDNQTVRPNWFLGVLLHVPLVSRVDRGKTLAASRLEQQRVEVTAQQASRDIPTQIEKQWRVMDHARIQFLSMGSTVELAQEDLRLQSASFQQGQATSVDVTDARLQLARAEIERVQAAYDYVTALAQLLEASGQPHRLTELAAKADIVVSSDAR